MELQPLIERVARFPVEGRFRVLLPGLGLGRATAPYDFEANIYEPLVCLILQGAKQTSVAGRTAVVGAGQFILVSHHLPAVARVISASPDVPYLCLIARLDLSELRGLQQEVGEDDNPGTGESFEVGDAPPELVSVLSRYVALADDAEGQRVLLPMVRRELHYRLLKADRAGMLRQLLSYGSRASNITRAIRMLREGFRGRIEMDDVARRVGMSPSSFYKHFRSVTSTTPLQYQKDLRLTEAQRLLRGGEHSVSSAAFAVGYESASQFSREYSRRFGAPPRSELGR